MSRRQTLENIIIGTLLDLGADYYGQCKSVITGDMFLDPTNRRIYGLIVEMKGKGMKDTTPYDIYNEYGKSVVDIVPRMCELVAEWSFVYKKMEHNELCWLIGILNGVDLEYTNVSFEDYVNGFVQNVFNDEREDDNHRRGQSTAA